MKQEDKSDNNHSSARLLVFGWDIVFQLGIPLGLGVWGGLRLDEYLLNNGNLEKNYHIFLIMFSLIGLGLGFYNVYMTAKKFFKDQDKDEDSRQ